VASRTLERRFDVSNVTVEACIRECFVQSFTIAGLEYAQECCKLITNYDIDAGLIDRGFFFFFFEIKGCGNEIKSPGAPISQSVCNQACVGNNTEVCGGPDALQIYRAN